MALFKKTIIVKDTSKIGAAAFSCQLTTWGRACELWDKMLRPVKRTCEITGNAIVWALRAVRLVCLGALYLIIAACVAWAGMALFQQEWTEALSYLLAGCFAFLGLIAFGAHGMSFRNLGYFDNNDDCIFTDPGWSGIPGNIYNTDD